MSKQQPLHEDYSEPPPSYEESSSFSKQGQTSSALGAHDTLLFRQDHPPELVEQVAAFLEDYERRYYAAGEVVEVTFLPGNLAREGWSIVDPEQLTHSEPLETRVLQWVDTNPKRKDGRPAEGSSKRNEFDGWGRWTDDGAEPSDRSQWWSDETKAQRIAREMSPVSVQLRQNFSTSVKEAVLRRENDMGLWERKAVYGIAVKMSTPDNKPPVLSRRK